MVENVRIPKSVEDEVGEGRGSSRLAAHILEWWVLSWLQVGSNLDVLKEHLMQVLGHIKLSCIPTYQSGKRQRNHTAPVESLSLMQDTIITQVNTDRRMAFWIANLCDFLCNLQWTISVINEKEKERGDQERLKKETMDSIGSREFSKAMLVILQLRTDVTRVIEEIYRAWLAELFHYYSRLGIPALLDHQGLTGFSTDIPLKNNPQLPPSASPSLRLFMLPFSRLAVPSRMPSSPSSHTTTMLAPTIEDLVGSLEGLADALESCSLQSEISVQIFLSVISNITSAALNQLLFRRNYASWKRGIQIQYNISRLEEWANLVHSKRPNYFFSRSTLPSPLSPIARNNPDHEIDLDPNHDYSAIKTVSSPLVPIEPLIQAVKLLQLAKTRVAADLDALLEACPKLNLAQVRKILSLYVPDAYEDGPVAPEILRALTLRIQKKQQDTQEVLVETFSELQAHSVPLQLSIKPIEPVTFSELPTPLVPPHLWKVFALVDARQR